MLRIVPQVTLFCVIGLVPCLSQDETPEIYRRMVSQSVQAVMEEYHVQDWKKTTQTAAKFWRDPTTALDQKVKNQFEKLHRFLLKTFLGDLPSIKSIEKFYFEQQLDYLVEDYKKAPVSRYQLWSRTPSHYQATLAYELLAVQLNIKLDRNYHEFFSLESERARFIEEALEKIHPPQAPNVEDSAPPPPPPLPSLIAVPTFSTSLKLNHLTKDRPQKPKRTPQTILNQDTLMNSLSSLKKTTTTTQGASSLSENVLNEIRKGGFKLNKASNRILKDQPEDQTGQDLLAILRKRFNSIRPAIEGEKN